MVGYRAGEDVATRDAAAIPPGLRPNSPVAPADAPPAVPAATEARCVVLYHERCSVKLELPAKLLNTKTARVLEKNYRKAWHASQSRPRLGAAISFRLRRTGALVDADALLGDFLVDGDVLEVDLEAPS